tara:strand:+ start:1325 stop:2053 length:729 start_codon:yes stop_codon:yes gene_type:complete
MLKGKTVLVTGGTKGIGRAICMVLAKEGHHIISFSSNVDNVKSLQRALDNLGVGSPHKIFVYDVFDNDMEYGGGNADILVNNVGGGGSWGMEENVMEENVMEINYFSQVRYTSMVLDNMEKKKWGRVITISSIYGKEAHDNSYFCAAKSAQNAYMKSMAKKKTYARKNITFNTVSPGRIMCGNYYKHNKNTAKFKKLVKGTPMGKIGKPEDVANVVRFLCSNESSYINGANIIVDGGESVAI